MFSEYYFSSYTKGLFTVTCIKHDSDQVWFSFEMTEEINRKLQKKVRKFGDDITLSIDGVAASAKLNDKQSVLDASVQLNIYNNSTLSRIVVGDTISIGLQSKNEKKFLINHDCVSTVKFLSAQIADGHEFTQELSFQAPKSLYPLLNNSKWIGLNGSGFFLQDVTECDDVAVFKIHVGQTTRDRTIFSSKHLSSGMEFNLSSQVTSNIASISVNPR